MAHNNIEIEIQVKIEHPEALIVYLKQNARFQSEKHQMDEYFTPAHRDFLGVRPAVEWLRLRNADGVASINYKNWHLDEQGKSHHCDELETTVGDIDCMKKIFSSLNIRSLVIVDKIRKTWIYKDFEIAMDTVKGLGDFVEIEYIGKDPEADPKVITASMMDFLKTVGVGTITRNFVGYPFLLLFPEEVKVEVL